MNAATVESASVPSVASLLLRSVWRRRLVLRFMRGKFKMGLRMRQEKKLSIFKVHHTGLARRSHIGKIKLGVCVLRKRKYPKTSFSLA